MFASRSKLALEVLAAAHEPKPSPRLLLLVEFIDDVVLDGNDLVPELELESAPGSLCARSGRYLGAWPPIRSGAALAAGYSVPAVA